MDNHLWDRNEELVTRIVEELKAEAWTPENLERVRRGAGERLQAWRRNQAGS